MTLDEMIFRESDFVGKDIASLPDRVIGAAEEMKARFDYVAKEMLALGRFNDLLRLLSGSGCAGELGFAATRSIAADNVQAAIEALSAQLQAAVIGQIPDSSVSARKLADGAAAENLGAGSVSAEKLAAGAAAANLEAGSVTQEKLDPAILQNLKGSTALESLTTVLEDWALAAGGGQLSLQIPVDLRSFLAGFGGRVVVRIAPGSWRCTELELRHDPSGSGLSCVVRGGCAETAAAAPRDSWQAGWQSSGGKLLYFDTVQGTFLGLHSLIDQPDAGDCLLVPTLGETMLTLPVSWTAAEERTLRATIQVEVWR